jgi:2-succinyl-5-enolpyruvyl-6-hydroxy-3-cyclohexene-1-carboxylate synthase
MSAPRPDSHLLLRAFADELVRCGVTDAVTSPGSRSTPVVLALARQPGLRAHSQVDERAAAFFALGIAKATRRPVVLACTSGTAAAEYLPAVIEAHEAGVPLIVLTADRPPELRDSGAGQTIDQVKLYGAAVRWYVDLGIHEASASSLRWARALACRVAWVAQGSGGRPGPVHVDVPLREPLVPQLPLPDDPQPGRPGGAPWLARPAAAPASSAGTLSAAVIDHERIVVVAGRSERDPRLPDVIEAFADAAGAPLLADMLSGVRRSPNAIAHYDALLRDGRFAAAQRPDLVLRVGDLPTSKPLRAWLASLDASIPQLAFDPEAVWHDPDATLHASLPGDPGASLLHAAADLAERGAAREGGAWLAAWRAADASAAAAIDATIGAEALNEPLVARTAAAALPAGETLFVASSMPVRDLETFAAVREDAPRVLCNRGANGIDGTIASALGVAATGAPTTLLIGDVALAYDHGALAALCRGLIAPLTIVLVDNAGGGIFDFLPVGGPAQADVYEEHVATPTGLEVAHICALYGLDLMPVARAEQLHDALATLPGGPRLLHVRTERAENVVLHRRVWDAVAAAL